jgi:anti-sigma B factor antagonist
LKVDIRRIEDIVVVDMAGEFTLRNTPDLRKQLEEITDIDNMPVIFDFSQILSIDSSGLGCLVLLQHRLRERNQRMLLANPSAQIKMVFDKVNLNRLFVICSSITEAVFALRDKKVLTLVMPEDKSLFYTELLRINHIALKFSKDCSSVLHDLRNDNIDLLLLDVAQGDKDAYSLIKKIRNDVDLAGLPIVVVSIYEEEEDNLAKLGIEHFFRDPFEVDQFIDTIWRLA